MEALPGQEGGSERSGYSTGGEQAGKGAVRGPSQPELASGHNRKDV